MQDNNRCIQGEQCNCRHNKNGKCNIKPKPAKICLGIICMNMVN